MFVRPPLQVLAAAAILAVLPLLPRTGAPMLVVPLGSDRGAAALDRALAQGGRLLGTGPWRGTLVVRGTDARFARDMLARGVLVVAAPARLCGDAA